MTVRIINFIFRYLGNFQSKVFISYFNYHKPIVSILENASNHALLLWRRFIKIWCKFLLVIKLFTTFFFYQASYLFAFYCLFLHFILIDSITGKPTEKRTLGRPRRRWEDNFRMDLKEIGINTRDLVDSAQDRDY